ncbi:MAG TPA: GPP34 family phosphoprotein [Streptosporangiaceae bacterium]|nr:GPP34 family phosphoprotein [Streptosporangiaceae bacterium]
MESLGEDLLLVALDPASGVLHGRGKLPYGLMGAELVMLVSAGLVSVADGRVVEVAPGRATGDLDLDAALGRIALRPEPPGVRNWVASPRANITRSYLARLVAAGAIGEREGSILRPRWPVHDLARAGSVRARLDAVALGTGDADAAQVTFAGLADAIGLGWTYYQGWRLREITSNDWAASAVRDAIQAANAGVFIC